MRIEMNRRAVWSLVLVTIGASALAASASGNPVDASRAGTPLELALWLIVVTVAAMSPIPLPRTGSFIRLNATTDVAALLVFGPVTASILGALSRVATRVRHRDRRPWRTIEEVGATLFSLSVAGAVYFALGGRTGADLFLAVNPLLPIAAAGIVYVLAETAVESMAMVLEMRIGAAPAWRTTFARRAPYDLALLPFGLFLAQTQLQLGPLGTAMFLLPLLFARYAMQLWLDAKECHVGSVRTLMEALDAADPFTRGHSTRIAAMAVRVARRLGLPDREVEQVEYAALLHDFGRTALRYDVLHKPGRLDESEQNEIRVHPRIGHDFVRRDRFFAPAAEIVLAHHEQPDGQGYPRGLAGDRIPVGSRIIMVVAAYDAMTTDRPYRPGLPPETAFEELLANCGTQFSPEIVEVLVELYAAGELTGAPSAAAHDTGEEPGGLAIPFAPGHALTVAARTDPGLVRENNEDRYGVAALEAPVPRALLVVADGMGGAAAGEVASGLAVERVDESCRSAAPSSTAPTILRAAFRDANDAVRRAARENAALGGMGTTCTAVLVDEHGLWIGHVGDTRAYLVSGDGVAVLTRDHTVGAELEHLAMGTDGARAVSRHVLTRCVGADVEIEPDIAEEAIPVEDGDVLVLCSDGLTGLVDPDEVSRIVLDADPDDAADRLVALARERGGPDNITAIVARVGARPAAPPKRG